MVIEREVLEQTSQISDERIVGLIGRLLDQREKTKEEQSELKKVKDYVESQKRRELELSDPKSDKSLITKAMLNEIVSKLKKSKEADVLPVMTEELRKAQSEPEKIRRREIFAKAVQDAGASVVDAYNMVDYSPQDKAVMRQRVINSMTDSELEEAFNKCVGDECKPLRTNLLKRGYRIEKKDDKSNKWEPVPVEEEEEKEKVESHF